MVPLGPGLYTRRPARPGRGVRQAGVTGRRAARGGAADVPWQSEHADGVASADGVLVETEVLHQRPPREMGCYYGAVGLSRRRGGIGWRWADPCPKREGLRSQPGPQSCPVAGPAVLNRLVVPAFGGHRTRMPGGSAEKSRVKGAGGTRGQRGS